jgi:hypothetical protein
LKLESKGFYTLTFMPFYPKIVVFTRHFIGHGVTTQYPDKKQQPGTQFTEGERSDRIDVTTPITGHSVRPLRDLTSFPAAVSCSCPGSWSRPV